MAADSAIDHDDDLEANKALYDAVEALEDEQAAIDRKIAEARARKARKQANAAALFPINIRYSLRLLCLQPFFHCCVTATTRSTTHLVPTEQGHSSCWALLVPSASPPLI